MKPKRTIRIACRGADVAELDDLKELQGDLKTLSKEAYNQLRNEIADTGFAFPFSIWKNKKELVLIGGHQRKRVLTMMRDQDGYIVPPLPINFIEASSLKEARRRVLQDIAQYGRIETQGLYEFMTDAEIPVEDLYGSFSLPDIDIPKFDAEYFGEPGSTNAVDEPYTKKIETPIYEPRGAKPKTTELYSDEKTNQLLSEIDKAKLPKDISAFLHLAAHRHTVFDYEQIAEFYAHAPKEIQDLMEKSALVIVDFEKAIENGFVTMSKDIAEAYPHEAD